MLPADRLLLILSALLLTFACRAEIPVEYHSGAQLHQLPWQAADNEHPWAGSQPNGGGFNTLIDHVVPSWRRFGPGTPNPVSELTERLNIPLLATHPLTGNIIPMLADRWYTDESTGISYFHIDDDAIWSDGIPVTSSDFAYTVQFLGDISHGTSYQSELLHANIAGITIFDPGYFAIRHAPGTMPAFIRDLKPLPAHFYQTDIRWPGGFDETPEPVTGPYEPLSMDFNSITLKRVTGWWGDRQRFLSHRFHVTDIRLQRSTESSYKAFVNGEVDLLTTTAAGALNSAWITKLSGRYHVRRLSCDSCVTEYSGVIFSPDVAEADRLALLTQINALLNSQTFATDTPPAVTLYYPENEKLSVLATIPGATAEPADALVRRIEDGNFSAVFVTAPAGPASPEQTLREIADAYHTNGIVAAVDHISYHHYVFWEWLRVPVDLPASRFGLFDPFDAVYGGYFSIDKKFRAELMNQPERDDDAVAEPISHYP